MNARLRFQLTAADIARLEIQDQIDIAHVKLDAARGKDDVEFAFQLGRIHALRSQLGTSTFKQITVSRDDREHYGPRDEQQREDNGWRE